MRRLRYCVAHPLTGRMNAQKISQLRRVIIQKLMSSVSIYRGLPKNIYYLAIARMVLGMGNFIIPFLVLLLTEKLGYSVTVAGSLAMGVTATYFVGSFLGGKFADFYGHKSVLIFGELSGAILLILCGFVSEAKLLIPVLLFGAYFL